MRKRLFDIVGIVALLAGVVTLSATINRGPTRVELPAATPFASFPIGTVQTFDFDFKSDAEQPSSALERKLQAEDWMFMAIVGDSGLPQKDLRRVLFDLPPARFDFLDGITDLEYGETRSRSLGNGEVVALIPAGNADVQKDYLAAVGDRERKNVGSKPAMMHVFEYDFDADSKSGSVRRLPDVKGADVFSPAYGYVEQRVVSLADLQKFVSKSADLTSIEFSDGGITFAGRAVPALKYRGIGLSEVAALWQAEKKLEKVEQAISEFDARWSTRTYRYDYEKAALQKEHDDEWKKLSASLGMDAGSKGRASHTGFSLDPVFDYAKLQVFFKLFQEELEKTSQADKVGEIRAALAREDEGPLLESFYALSQSADQRERRVSAFAKDLLDETKFQHARYDGDLAGTEVGMILFYTDLLAKLYAMDYASSSPQEGVVPDFVPLLHASHSSIYDKDMVDHSNTRLWFGVLDDGFQGTESGMLFARNATRVYAAGSDPLQPGKESEPNVESAQFLGWWNNHYELMAHFEPEYQRLNEVMKWSIAFSWLKKNSHFDEMSFLSTDAVKVDRSARFPDWVRLHPELKFKRWDAVGFFPPNYKGVVTESLPLLHNGWHGQGLIGGVSLASKELVAERPLLNKGVDEMLRRPNFTESEQGGVQVLQRMDKTAFELAEQPNLGVADIRIRPRTEAKLRSIEMEFKNQSLDMHIDRAPDGLRMSLKAGDQGARAMDLGEARILRTKTGFKAGLADEQFRAQTRMMRDLSRENPSQWQHALESNSDVKRAIFSKDAKSIAIRDENNQWRIIQPEGTPSSDVAEGEQFRFAAFGTDNSQRLQSRAVGSEEEAISALGGGKKWNTSGDSGNPRFAKLSDDPPPSGKSIREDLWRQTNDLSERMSATKLLVDDGYARYVSKRNEVVRAIDEKIANKKFASGDMDEIRQYCKTFQHDPTVRARGAIAEAEAGDYAEAVSDLNRLFEGGNATIVEQSLGKLPTKNTGAIRDALRLRNSYGSGSGRGVFLLAGDDGIRIEVRIADLSQATEVYAVKPGARSLIYDGSPSFIRPGGPVTQEAGATRRLTNWEVGFPAPDQIRDLKTGSLYRISSNDASPATKISLNSAAKTAPRLYRSNQQQSQSCDSDPNVSERSDCNTEIILRVVPPSGTDSGRA